MTVATVGVLAALLGCALAFVLLKYLEARGAAAPELEEEVEDYD